jgi:hypothetical protein
MPDIEDWREKTASDIHLTGDALIAQSKRYSGLPGS